MLKCDTGGTNNPFQHFFPRGCKSAFLRIRTRDDMSPADALPIALDDDTSECFNNIGKDY